MYVNKHELRMNHLRAAAGETRATKYNLYTVISYDMDSGDVIADTYPDCNSWAVFWSPAIVHVCRTNCPMTMQQIADAVAATVAEYQ